MYIVSRCSHNGIRLKYLYVYSVVSVNRRIKMGINDQIGSVRRQAVGGLEEGIFGGGVDGKCLAGA